MRAVSSSALQTESSICSRTLAELLCPGHTLRMILKVPSTMLLFMFTGSLPRPHTTRVRSRQEVRRKCGVQFPLELESKFLLSNRAITLLC